MGDLSSVSGDQPGSEWRHQPVVVVAVLGGLAVFGALSVLLVVVIFVKTVLDIVGLGSVFWPLMVLSVLSGVAIGVVQGRGRMKGR